ncbi:MAG: hypothetical protein LBT78_10670, partial [Tannerella sp.]|nr:hypothetical protein [Tannerella sp.]
DYVIYSGDETEIDLTKTDVAAFGFTFSVASGDDKIPDTKLSCEVKQGLLNAEWNGLKVCIPVKPEKKPGHI